MEGRRTFQWRGKLIRGATSRFTLDDAAGSPLMLFRSGAPIELITTRVEVTPWGLALTEWPLLPALGYYLRMLMGRTWR